MNKNEAIKAAQNLFKSYPGVDEFHVTTDGQGFAQKSDAESHSVTLDKKNPVVHFVKRDDKVTAEKTEKTALELAEAKVVTAKQAVNKLQAAFDSATEAKKAKAKTALDAALETLTAAEKEVEELTA